MFHTTRTFGVIAAIAIVFPSLAHAQVPPPDALDRIDPVVLLTQGKEVDGKADLKVVRSGFTYFFSTPETKATFEKTPDKYEIQLGGACARMGPSAGGNPSDFLVYDGRIYIFGSDECHKKFAEAPVKYLAKPAPPMPASAKSVEDGRAILARLVAALGGNSRLDAITTYVEKASRVEKRPQGEMAIATTTQWRFPNEVRSTRVVSMAGRTQTSSTLLTPAGAWYIAGSGQAYPVRSTGRPDTERPFSRQVVALLRARQDAGVKVAALPRTTIDGVAFDRVRIVSGVADVTLMIDASTGRLHGMSFVDRNTEGELGEFTIAYSDFRTVEGLTLPFRETSRFNGSPDESLTRTIESIAVNVPIDPSIFAAPGL